MNPQTIVIGDTQIRLLSTIKGLVSEAEIVESEIESFSPELVVLSIGPEEIDRIIPESIGICIFRLNKTPKPTTNFLQLFGNEIDKNVVELNKKLTIDYCRGLNLEINSNVEPGFVIVKYKNITLGCGHWNGHLLKNQIPKSRFCQINFL